MKSTVNDAPLRGEAAWRAEKLAIAERNKAACAKAGAERGRRDAAVGLTVGRRGSEYACCHQGRFACLRHAQCTGRPRATARSGT